jgi:hypothetical protein
MIVPPLSFGRYEEPCHPQLLYNLAYLRPAETELRVAHFLQGDDVEIREALGCAAKISDSVASNTRTEVEGGDAERGDFVNTLKAFGRFEHQRFDRISGSWLSAVRDDHGDRGEARGSPLPDMGGFVAFLKND